MFGDPDPEPVPVDPAATLASVVEADDLAAPEAEVPEMEAVEVAELEMLELEVLFAQERSYRGVVLRVDPTRPKDGLGVTGLVS